MLPHESLHEVSDVDVLDRENILHNYSPVKPIRPKPREYRSCKETRVLLSDRLWQLGHVWWMQERRQQNEHTDCFSCCIFRLWIQRGLVMVMLWCFCRLIAISLKRIKSFVNMETRQGFWSLLAATLYKGYSWVHRASQLESRVIHSFCWMTTVIHDSAFFYRNHLRSITFCQLE